MRPPMPSKSIRVSPGRAGAAGFFGAGRLWRVLAFAAAGRLSASEPTAAGGSSSLSRPTGDGSSAARIASCSARRTGRSNDDISSQPALRP